MTQTTGSQLPEPETDVQPCAHFGSCGGCSLRDRPYAEQIELKRKKLKDLLLPFWSEDIFIHKSPQISYYRNKAEISFSRQVKERDEQNNLVFENCLGFKFKKRWDKTIDLCGCFLVSPETAPLLESVRKWARESGLSYYDLRKHSGFLRHLVLREAKNTGERMVILVTGEGEFDGKGFCAAVKSAYPALTICRAVNSGISDVAVSDKTETLEGPGFIRERLDTYSSPDSPAPERSLFFNISPFSFFQTNPIAAQMLYSSARRRMKEIRPRLLLDLYGGAGAFSFACADIAEKCVCVESSPYAFEDGGKNALLNGITNVEFVCAKTEDYLRDLPGALLSSGFGISDTAVIADPPRCGFHPKALSALCGFKSRSIIYVSCNPSALVRDLNGLAENYKIDLIEGFDLFPHTEHIETAVFLSLR